MRRTTIQLPEALNDRAMRLAKERGISLGDLICEALVSLLDQPPGDLSKDPLFADQAVYEGPSPPKLAEDHDRYLYGDGSDLH